MQYIDSSIVWYICIHTVNVERFVGLKTELSIHNFNLMRFFAVVLSQYLDQQCLLFTIAKYLYTSAAYAIWSIDYNLSELCSHNTHKIICVYLMKCDSIWDLLTQWNNVHWKIDSHCFRSHQMWTAMHFKCVFSECTSIGDLNVNYIITWTNAVTMHLHNWLYVG